MIKRDFNKIEEVLSIPEEEAVMIVDGHGDVIVEEVHEQPTE